MKHIKKIFINLFFSKAPRSFEELQPSEWNSQTKKFFASKQRLEAHLLVYFFR